GPSGHFSLTGQDYFMVLGKFYVLQSFYHGLIVRQLFHFGELKRTFAFSQGTEAVISSDDSCISTKPDQSGARFRRDGLVVIETDIFLENGLEQFSIIRLFFKGMREEKIFFPGYQGFYGNFFHPYEQVAI